MTDKCDVCGKFMSSFRDEEWICSDKCRDVLNKELKQAEEDLDSIAYHQQRDEL